MNNIIYFKIVDTWKALCEEHFNLLSVTFDEYSLLLDSDIGALESKTIEKNEIIKSIYELDLIRKEIIEEINARENDINKKIHNSKDLLRLALSCEQEKTQRHLERFNNLLIDLIEKIQAQNKKNQSFLNKAIKSIREIREQITGEKSFSTYTSKGSAKLNLTKRD